MLRLDTVDVSESQPCGAPRGVRRQTASLVRVLKQRQVRVDLTGEIAIGPPNAEQVQQAFEESGAWAALLSFVEQQLIDERRQHASRARSGPMSGQTLDEPPAVSTGLSSGRMTGILLGSQVEPGPTKQMALPSGSRTMKSRPPHACFLSFCSNVTPAVT